MRKILTIIIIACTVCFSFSQEGGQKNARYTIRGNVGIPRPVSSKMFRTSFAAIYEANLSVNLRLFDNFYAGVGYQNTFFRNNKFLKQQYFNTSIPYTTSLSGQGIFVRLGYDKFLSDVAYVSYSVNSGIMLARYADVNPDTSVANMPYGSLKFTAPYIQPEVAVNFIAEKRLSFSIMLSYTTMLYNFDPKSPRFNQFEKINKASNNYFMSWINIGFGVNVLLGK